MGSGMIRSRVGSFPSLAEDRVGGFLFGCKIETRYYFHEIEDRREFGHQIVCDSPKKEDYSAIMQKSLRLAWGICGITQLIVKRQPIHGTTLP
jgi:hypothetical protein